MQGVGRRKAGAISAAAGPGTQTPVSRPASPLIFFAFLYAIAPIPDRRMIDNPQKNLI